jgi:hypothetical protein
MTLQFESEQTIRYQIQEMLRIEKIFEEEGIQQEIEAYAPLVPDGSNWKATMLIEYPDINERKRELARLIGVEDRMFVEVEGHARVYAIADEDLDRENDEKTSAVHFVRFELTPAMRAGGEGRRRVKLGCDHTHYPAHVRCSPTSRQRVHRPPSRSRHWPPRGGGHRRADVGDALPVGGRAVAVGLGAGMHHQLGGAAVGHGLRIPQHAGVVTRAQPHLGRQRHAAGRHRAAHGAHDAECTSSGSSSRRRRRGGG